MVHMHQQCLCQLCLHALLGHNLIFASRLSLPTLQTCSAQQRQYIGKDLVEMASVLKGVPEPLQPIFKEVN